MSKEFTEEEIKAYEKLSKKLNCFIIVERNGKKMEFWGPYYNYYERRKTK